MNWQSTILPGFGPKRQPILSVVAKRTYTIAPGTTLPATNQLPLNHSDLPADDQNPLFSDLIAENELIAYKPATDFVVLGKAHAPRGKKAFHLDCEVHAGILSKKITVYGERHLESKALRGLCFSEPLPFESQPLGYEYAYGGRTVSKKGTVFTFPPNPLGTGFNIKSGVKEYANIKVPHCEDPATPLSPDHCILDKYDQWPHCPSPASFGFTRPTFYPRYTYAGILPEMIVADQPIDPKTPRLDFRFYQCASAGLGDQLLYGNEPIRLVYMDPLHPVFEFALPGTKPAIALTIGSTTTELEPALHTVFIDKEKNLLSMVWRGYMVYGGIDELAGKQFSFRCAD